MSPLRLYFGSSNFRNLGITLVTYAALSLSVNSQGIDEPTLPHEPSSGFFPTQAEDVLLRGGYNSRLFGPVNEGPDAREQIATGMFPYQDPEPNFYQRNSAFFRPLDQTLGVFTGFDAWTVESDTLQNAAITVDAHGGIFTRTFDPNLAMIKAGPLFLDLLWIGAGGIWSDFQGTQRFGPDQDDGDGFAAYIDLGARAMLRLTDTFYLSVAASVMYLPIENRFAFGAGYNSGIPGLGVSLVWGNTAGAWDLLLYDNFWGRSGVNFFADTGMGATDRAGRYFFGFQNPRGNEFYSNSGVIFGNQLGFNATRLVFGNQWRYNFDIDHYDYWRTFSFRDHDKRDHIGTSIAYEGSIIPFAPRLSYDMYAYNGYESIDHLFALMLTGRVTENISWTGQVGVLFNDDRERVLWQVGLDHAITKNTAQWLRFGEWYFQDDFSAQSTTARLISYGISQRFGRRSSLTAFAQYSDEDSGASRAGQKDRFAAGLRFSYQPLDFTSINVTALYDTHDSGNFTEDPERWLYRVELIQQLGIRLTGQLFYQYEESSDNASFSEHAVGLSLRRYF